MHYHKIDVFIDKCTKNHLKMRSFDWLKKCQSFVKKHEKYESLEKRMVLRGIEPMTIEWHTWQKTLKASKLPLGQTRICVSGPKHVLIKDWNI